MFQMDHFGENVDQTSMESKNGGHCIQGHLELRQAGLLHQLPHFKRLWPSSDYASPHQWGICRAEGMVPESCSPTPL